MRVTSSMETLPVHKIIVDPQTHSKSGHHHLNFEYVTQLVAEYDASSPDSESEPASKKGKKRASPKVKHENKRARLENLSSEAQNDGPGTRFPAWEHTIDIMFSSSPDPPARSKAKADANVKALEDALKTHKKRYREDRVSLGPAFFFVERSRPALFTSPAVRGNTAGSRIKWPEMVKIVSLPLFDGDGFNPVEHDYSKPSAGLRDLLVAASNLRDTDRAYIDITWSINLLSEDGVGVTSGQLPFTLTVLFTLSLNSPFIFGSIYDLSGPLAREAQRRMLSFLFPLPPDPSLHHHRGRTDIPFFFSCLSAAPSLPYGIKEDMVQPKRLKATLLPFQRRSVAWLLRREGKMFDKRGNVVNISDEEIDTEVSPFWVNVDVPHSGMREGVNGWWLNPLTGDLRDQRPVLEVDERFLGAMLSETMGLGKTMEIIALILHNTPIERNLLPAVFDEEAAIQVKPVKSTLIVTPPGLQQQWIDEMATHAPTLKVFVYEGWSKLLVPVTYLDQESNAEKGKRKAGSRLKAVPNTTTLVKVTIPMALREDKSNNRSTSPSLLAWFELVEQYDCVITTYAVLQSDLDFAHKPHQRPRRETAEYSDTMFERPRSPLIAIEFARVVMDEVQQIGTGKGSEMVSLIPRLASFAVSGTPAKANLKDLHGPLKFLRVPEVTSLKTWNRLLHAPFASIFARFFNQICVRTTKEQASKELSLPGQSKVVVPITLGPVEKHNYDGKFQEGLEALHLDERGVAVIQDWELDVVQLRTLLSRLRQACTHPEVGNMQANAGPGGGKKRAGGNEIRSIGEVLDGMIEKNTIDVLDDKRAYTRECIEEALLVQRDQGNPTRRKVALQLLLDIRTQAEKDVTETRKGVVEAQKLVRKARAAKNACLRGDHPPENASTRNQKGKAKSTSTPTRDESSPNPEENDMDLDGVDTEDDEDDDEDEEDEEGSSGHVSPALRNANLKLKAVRSKLTGAKLRVREARIIEHKVNFLLGDLYHQLGRSTEENESYETADALRRSLLARANERAMKAMADLEEAAADHAISPEDLMIEPTTQKSTKTGPAQLYAGVNSAIKHLDEQAQLLYKWRDDIIKLLTQSLNFADDKDADGQEYMRSLETQNDAEAYIQAFAALVADRKETLTAQRTALHEERTTKKRKTKSAKRAEEADSFDVPEELLAGDQVALAKRLHDQRKALKGRHTTEPLKSLQVQIGRLIEKVPEGQKESTPSQNARAESERLKEILAEQGALIDKFDDELRPLRKCFNERILYFRQLQELSDSVEDPDRPHGEDPNYAIQACKTRIAELQKRIQKGQASGRYLAYMAAQQNADEMDEDDRVCTLCKCEFVRGFLTTCAHVYCEECLPAWQKREGKNAACPQCRAPLEDDIHRIIFSSPSDEQSEADTTNLSAGPRKKTALLAPIRSKAHIEYNELDRETLREIQAVEVLGSYGSKIETLIRHLTWVQSTDPGAKSIVFSAWADSLTIVAHALKSNHIPFVRVDQHGGKAQKNAVRMFCTDEQYQVLLLHGERENAGLNVIEATRVFLLEPVVNPAFEVQAIARIDRIGQTRNTQVLCYYAEDTVEKNILDLAYRKGHSLYAKGDSAALGDNLTSAPEKYRGRKLTQAKRAGKGDFVASTEDMLAVVFPQLSQPIEDIDFGDDEPGEPSENEQQEEQLILDAAIATSLATSREADSMDIDSDQPIAGPSRL